ncbi:MAG TPA: zinc ribbon domain-containing protein [Acidimicrobiales bacterium]|nr:zinc ribbon domain-containing protein [Acidimicrobiales bacterium]
MTARPAVEGWFSTGAVPELLGDRCAACGVVSFPPGRSACADPACGSDRLVRDPIGRAGTVWSLTDARYQPPAPYRAAEPYEPFGIAAVAVEPHGIVVLGQLAHGVSVADLAVGDRVELVVETLFADESGDELVWRWAPEVAG